MTRATGDSSPFVFSRRARMHLQIGAVLISPIAAVVCGGSGSSSTGSVRRSTRNATKPRSSATVRRSCRRFVGSRVSEVARHAIWTNWSRTTSSTSRRLTTPPILSTPTSTRARDVGT
jgi:hypothetical protein